MRKLKILSLTAVLLTPSYTFAQEISKGKILATTCFICHGTQGRYTDGTLPPLAGYPEKIMARRLKAYKRGELYATMMQRQISGYTNKEIDALAKYFGSLEPS